MSDCAPEREMDSVSGGYLHRYPCYSGQLRWWAEAIASAADRICGQARGMPVIGVAGKRYGDALVSDLSEVVIMPVGPLKVSVSDRLKPVTKRLEPLQSVQNAAVDIQCVRIGWR